MPDSGIGDIVMSVLDLATFRKAHADHGPDYVWFPCDGSDISATALGTGLPKTPDFRQHYPRGYDSPGAIPNLAPGETGAPGSVIGQRWIKHSHAVPMPVHTVQSRGPGDGSETCPTPNPQTGTNSWGTTEAGDSSENRPNSVVVFFYIRARL
jgi:hypothetical protein